MYKRQGIFWSIQYDGKPEDTTKHTYNQAFAIYALSSYYEASGDEEALSIAKELYHIVENKCTDEIGYLEAFNKEFHLIENDKLSENGIIADKTMNTLLHVFEAYTELYLSLIHIFSDQKGVSEEMRARIKQLAKEMGYQTPTAARLSSNKRTYNIGVLL